MTKPTTKCLPGRKIHGRKYMGKCIECGAVMRDVRRAQLDRVNRSNRTQTAQSHGDTAQRA